MGDLSPGGGEHRVNTPLVLAVFAALVGLVCAVLVVWLAVVVSSDGESSAPSPRQTRSTGPPPIITHTEWGEFPPKNLDSLNDLSEADFPDRVGSYVFDKADRSPYGVIADYSEPDTYRTMSADLDFDTFYYAKYLESLTDVAYYGDAICGFSQGVFVQPSCVMVGKSEMLTLGTADKGATLEEVAAFTAELYRAL